MAPAILLKASKIGVLGDCHIHPGQGLDWPSWALDAVAGTDLIVTLGDMGEAAALDRLAAVAPVIGVRGRDDAADDRTAAALRVLQIGKLRIGCVFDPTEHGLSSHADPFTPLAGWATRANELFDGPIQALLHASTHRSSVVRFDGVLIVNPGSAVLPADGALASIALLKVDGGTVEAEIVTLADPL
jgi:uncharacterized protein